MRSVDQSINKLIEVRLKHADRTFDVIFTIAKFRISSGDEKEKEK